MDRREFLRQTALSTAVGVAAATGCSVSQSTENNDTDSPVVAGPISGSFFDLIHVNTWDAAYWTDTCRFWKEDNWRALIRQMHSIGIKTAICVSTANWGRPMFGGYEKTVGKPLKFGCDDPLGVCVDEIERLGMDVFLGVGFRGRVSQVRDYQRMQKPWSNVWFRWNTALAEALVDRFGSRKCFSGLYIGYEIGFEPLHIELYEKLMGEFIRPAIGDVTLLASPAVYQLDEDELASLPDKMVNMGIDIWAPQDCGGRKQNIDEAMEKVHRHVRALKALKEPMQQRGLALWSNIEVFGREQGPDGRPICIPGPIERIKQQIELQQPLVDKLICYQFQGIMNRHTNLVNIGHPDTDKLYCDYLEYIMTRQS